MRSAVLQRLGLAAAGERSALLGPPDLGQKAFDLRCARRRGGAGRGGEMGRHIVKRPSALRPDAQLARLIRQGVLP